MNAPSHVHSATASPGARLDEAAVQRVVANACPPSNFAGKRVLVIVPDSTRTAPVGLLFKTLHAQIAHTTSAFDIMIALGTHPPMSDEAICRRLEITEAQRQSEYRKVQFLNHQWDNPGALQTLGTISAEEIRVLSEGRFAMDVPVEINRTALTYDQIIIIGPVFPHEVVGFSGGNKYLFPGIGGPAILNFFHWLAAVVSNVKIIGNKWTPVRKVVDRAGAMVPIPKLCLAMVVHGNGLAGLYAGSPEDAWNGAADLSAQTHIEWKEKPFHTILSCAPPMYDELWVGGKCMYKLEPVLADGGELIIYAPHIHEVSITHGKLIREVGYHCREYFVKQWDRFKHYPWGVLAHCTHVFGDGAYDHGIEKPRARVTLATGLSEAECKSINLGYRDWRSIRPEDFAGREEEGVLHVPKAGEVLYKLRQ